MEAASANAHYIWYYFAAIALVSACGPDYLRESSTSVGCEEGGSNTVRFILLNSKMPVGFPYWRFLFYFLEFAIN